MFAKVEYAEGETKITYSFLDCQATINGPGGSFSLGAGSGNAKEGISIEYLEDKNRMVIGADGTPMQTLVAAKAATLSIRLLKTSPVNGQLEQLYNYQTVSSLYHGQNTVRVTNPVTGDEYVANEVAFKKFPRNDYAEEAGMLEWVFDAGEIDVRLGQGLAVGA